ncbi:MAG: GIY-YIG nuclease family protein [bacterium]|nr:GIY-YIG nuclease family protein [bacterium]
MDKKHILAEIRRTAVGNGGLPWSSRRFEAETGIKESEWAGVHWARWADAVEEAGFSRKTLAQASDEEALLDAYIQLIRYLGRFPVRNELRMRARSSLESAHDDGFNNRWGGKVQTAARILAYCRSVGGYEDVASICAPIAARAADKSESGLGKAEENIGYVYLAQFQQSHYRIGRTKRVSQSEAELSAALPAKAKIIHAIKTDDPVGIEAYWQRRFEDRPRRGEWLTLTDEDVRAFKRRKTQ